METIMSNNSNPLVVCDILINQDAKGRFCLNDLHKAAGNEIRHKPAEWLRLDQTKELIAEVANALILSEVGNPITEKINNLEPVKIVKGFDQKQGTFVVKPLVYAYAMWISARFNLQVINAYDTLVTQKTLDFEFLKPITDPIAPEDFKWRYQVIMQMLQNLKKAQVNFTISMTGEELLASKFFEK
jgi:hypothetical protein